MVPEVQLGKHNARGECLAVRKTFGVLLPSLPRCTDGGYYGSVVDSSVFFEFDGTRYPPFLPVALHRDGDYRANIGKRQT